MKRSIRVSAPLVVALAGDYVYEALPLFASATDLRLTLTLSPATSAPRSADDVFSGLFILITKYLEGTYRQRRLPPFRYSLSFPADLHNPALYRSAFLAAGTAALLYAMRGIWNPQTAHTFMVNMRRDILPPVHEVDMTGSVFGGFLWYRKELTYLRSLWQLPLSSASHMNHCFLVVRKTGKPFDMPAPSESYIRTVAEIMKTGDTNALVAVSGKFWQDYRSPLPADDPGSGCFRQLAESGGALLSAGPIGAVCYHADAAVARRWARRYRLILIPISLNGEGVRLDSGKGFANT
ncbi:hypothetical protein M1555_04145 [Patescibacteria group bacterium]|nr:hypothetical protein [Patescibacteria group bacterium]